MYNPQTPEQATTFELEKGMRFTGEFLNSDIEVLEVQEDCNKLIVSYEKDGDIVIEAWNLHLTVTFFDLIYHLVP